jgi:hypothetical protein
MHAARAADLTIAVVEPLAGFVGAWVALGLLVVLAVTPILLEMAVLVAHWIAVGGVSADRYTAQLRRLGLTAWAVGPWGQPGPPAGRYSASAELATPGRRSRRPRPQDKANPQDNAIRPSTAASIWAASAGVRSPPLASTRRMTVSNVWLSRG